MLLAELQLTSFFLFSTPVCLSLNISYYLISTLNPQALAQNSFSKIMMYGEVAFRHLLLSSRSRKIIFNGCVDYAIGRAFLFLDPNNHLQKHFQSLVLLVEAKVGSTVEHAVPQLLIYLASSLGRHVEELTLQCMVLHLMASNGSLS
jgi:hypothetical protein